MNWKIHKRVKQRENSITSYHIQYVASMLPARFRVANLIAIRVLARGGILRFPKNNALISEWNIFTTEMLPYRKIEQDRKLETNVHL